MIHDSTTNDPYFQMRMIFGNREEFKKALTLYAVKNQRNLKVVKNDNVKVRVICHDKDYGWKILAFVDGNTGD